MSTQHQNFWVVQTSGSVPWAQIEPRIKEHLTYQDQLLSDGVLVAAGPFVDETTDGHPTGQGMTVLRADDRDEAERIARADPLVSEGLREVHVERWRVTAVGVRPFTN